MMRLQIPFTSFAGMIPKAEVILRVAACLALLALAGCRLPCLRSAEPGYPLPADFNGMSSPESSARLGIHEFFSDPVLTQLLTDGLRQNQELKIRNEEIQIAANEIRARRGAYLPFIFGNAGAGIEKNSRFTPLGAAEDQLTYPDGGNFPDPLPKFKVGANLFWQIDVWRELRNARDAAIQRYFATIERRNYLVTQLVAETAENYYELAALDKRLEFLQQTIEIQQRSLEVAQAQKEAARGTDLPVQRFTAEVRKNESQIQIVQQQILETENKINLRVGRFPQRVDREAWDLITFDSTVLCVGVPAEMLLNRRDVRAAEREVAASGLDVLVARARFFPRLDITAGVGYEAFHPKYFFDPEAFVANAAGDLVAPLINRNAIAAEYQSANARQLQAIYEYQRTVLTAFTEVVNTVNKVENYRKSVALKREQVEALERSVSVATDLFQGVRGEYVDVLFSQRDLLEARTDLIETKQQQLAAIVNAYKALGGGYLLWSSGTEFAELFCLPAGLPTYEMMAPQGATGTSIPSAFSPPLETPAAAPAGDAPPAAPGDVIKVPVPGEEGAASPPGKASVTPQIPEATTRPASAAEKTAEETGLLKKLGRSVSMKR